MKGGRSVFQCIFVVVLSAPELILNWYSSWPTEHSKPLPRGLALARMRATAPCSLALKARALPPALSILLLPLVVSLLRSAPRWGARPPWTRAEQSRSLLLPPPPTGRTTASASFSSPTGDPRPSGRPPQQPSHRSRRCVGRRACGWGSTLHLGPSRGHRRVRAGLPVLRRRSTIAEEPPTTVTDEPQCLLCFLIPSGTVY